LRDLPTLLSEATLIERRALIQEVFERVYLTPHQVMALRPRAMYADWLKLGRKD